MSDAVRDPAGGSAVVRTGGLLSGRGRVWLLNLALLSIASFMLVAERHLSAPRWGLGHVPFVALAGLFALSELMSVHVKFRQDSHSFTLSEIPMVLGFFAASPDQVALAQVVGAGLVLAIGRRQPPVKLVFNLCQYACTVIVAATVFRTLAAAGDPWGPLGWGSAAFATLVATVLGMSTIYLALSLSDAAPRPRQYLQPALFSVFNSLLACNMGLLAAETLTTHAYGVVLLVAPALGVYAANRAYVSQRERFEGLKFLHESTSLLYGTPDTDAAVDQVLRDAVEALRAETALLVYRPTESGRLRRRSTDIDDGERPGLDDSALAAALEAVESRLVTVKGALLFEEGVPVPAIQDLAGPTAIRNGIVVELRGETRQVGFLLVANHVSDVSGFTGADVRLLETLGRQLSAALENGRLEHALAQLREMESKLTHQATHDPLTGLANRSLFSQELTARLAGPDAEHLAVMFFDVDDFKTVNDSHGHAVGDALLVEVADYIRSAVGPSDLAARLSGDEFAVVLRQWPGDATARAVAQQVLADLSRPLSVCGRSVSVGVSVGIALNQEGLDTSGIMRNADTAMYAAKTGGKSRFVVFSPEMHGAALQRQELIRDLGIALEEDQFEVFFQPIMDLTSNGVNSAEALVRWRHPRWGLLGPDVFLPLLEETGLIARLTKLVLNKACVAAANWAVPEGELEPAVTVNLSARDFENEGLAGTVVSALSRSRLDPSRLILEITESAVLVDEDSCVRTLKQLSGCGVRIALDDFGTGYSSLSYLSHLPLHIVKLAKGFVDYLGDTASHDELARGIIHLGHILGLPIVAEGVERESQLGILNDFSCDYGQGYLIARPMPAPDFVDWLADHHRCAVPAATAA